MRHEVMLHKTTTISLVIVFSTLFAPSMALACGEPGAVELRRSRRPRGLAQETALEAFPPEQLFWSGWPPDQATLGADDEAADDAATRHVPAACHPWPTLPGTGSVAILPACCLSAPSKSC